MPNTPELQEIDGSIMVSGEEIQACLDAITPGLMGRPTIHGVIACLHVAIGLTYPDITPDELRDAVEANLEWIQDYPVPSTKLAKAPVSGLPN